MPAAPCLWHQRPHTQGDPAKGVVAVPQESVASTTSNAGIHPSPSVRSDTAPPAHRGTPQTTAPATADQAGRMRQASPACTLHGHCRSTRRPALAPRSRRQARTQAISITSVVGDGPSSSSPISGEHLPTYLPLRLAPLHLAHRWSSRDIACFVRCCMRPIHDEASGVLERDAAAGM